MALLFNALTCGLAKLDAEHSRMFQDISFVCDISDSSVGDDPFLKDLQLGGFLVPYDRNELDTLKYSHYRNRFSDQGFGLTIVPTFRCNFACDYCYQPDTIHQAQAPTGQFMSSDTQDKIVELVRRSVRPDGAFTVTWYGGEPLLCLETIESLTGRFREICAGRNAKYYSSIITNGYLLDSDGLAFLTANAIGFCQVTLDGPQDVHDSRRSLESGKETYERIVSNLLSIPDDSLLNVAIRVNVDRRNRESIGRLLSDLKARGFTGKPRIALYFSQVFGYSHGCRDAVQHCMITREFADWQADAFFMAIDLGFRISFYPAASLGNCGAVSAHSAIVEPNGAVHNCWNTVGVETLGTGALTQQNISPNENYFKWLAWSPFRAECVGCSILPLCMGGCPFKILYPEEVVDVLSNTCAT